MTTNKFSPTTIDNNGLYTDLEGDISQGTANASLTYEAFGDTSFLCYFFRHNQDDSLHMRFQLPHTWDQGTVYLHLHCVPMINPLATQVVVLDGKWAWAKHEEVVPAWASWTSFYETCDIHTTDQYKHLLLPANEIMIPVPMNIELSDVLLVYLRRPGSSDGTDTYSTNKVGGTTSANLALLSLDLHYRTNSHGSISINGE